MNTLETMQVPYKVNPDPYNTYPVPLLPPPSSSSGEQTFSAYRHPLQRTPGPAPKIENDLTAQRSKAIADDKDGEKPSGFEGRTEELKKQEAEARPIEAVLKTDLGRISDTWIARLLDRYLDQDRQV